MEAVSPLVVPAPAAGLHVLQVVGNGIVGGMESCVRRLVERLPRPRFRISALLPYECELADELRGIGAQVHVTPMPEEPSWASVQGSCALVQQLGVDILHAHLPPAHALAGLAGFLSDRPVLASIHGRQLTMLDLEVHRAAATHLHVVCEPSRRHALGVGVDGERITCIPNGVDTERFRPLPRPPDGAPRPGGLRAELKLPPRSLLAGFVGRLSPEKGPELFVQVALQLRGLAPELHFVMLGDGPLRPAVAAAIAGFGLEGRVHLAGERGAMPEIYPELDLLVSTSHSEAMPLAQMEAMACGVPVVATGVGGVPELIEHRRSGWLAGPGDAQALAAAARQLLHNEPLRRQMGEQARARAEQRFSLADSVRRTAALLERLHQDAQSRRAGGTIARRGRGGGTRAA